MTQYEVFVAMLRTANIEFKEEQGKGLIREDWKCLTFYVEAGIGGSKSGWVMTCFDEKGNLDSFAHDD